MDEAEKQGYKVKYDPLIANYAEFKSSIVVSNSHNSDTTNKNFAIALKS